LIAVDAQPRMEHFAVRHLSTEELHAGLDEIRRAPKDEGVLELIVRRPRKGEREVLEEGQLDLHLGLVGDSWKDRKSSRSADGLAHPDMQINVMSTRVIALVAQAKARWAQAGDQLFIDLDLSAANLPPGTQLAIGSAIIEVTAQPHTGCSQFLERFGADAMRFVNSPIGRELQMRGINARVVQAGTIRVGDVAKKLRAASCGVS
jgi:MOSC domain-containing protein YiiM